MKSFKTEKITRSLVLLWVVTVVSVELFDHRLSYYGSSFRFIHLSTGG